MKQKEEYYYENNKVADLIEILAIIGVFIGIIASFLISNGIKNLGVLITGIIISVVGGVLLYAFGELIDVLADIRTNTEHIRDYLESDN